MPANGELNIHQLPAPPDGKTAVFMIINTDKSVIPSALTPNPAVTIPILTEFLAWPGRIVREVHISLYSGRLNSALHRKDLTTRDYI